MGHFAVLSRGAKPRHLADPPDHLQLADQSQREENPLALIEGGAPLWLSVIVVKLS